MIGIDRIAFFFQAEDGIRYIGVTGVQTCALPIYIRLRHGGVHETQVTNRRRERRGPDGGARGLADELPPGNDGNLFLFHRLFLHGKFRRRSEEHTSELQSRQYLVCRLLLEKKKKK